MVRKANRHWTFYPRQVIQLRYLVSLAMMEATHSRHSRPKRYTILCRCSTCGDEDAHVQGAVRAIQWVCSHNRHRTFVKGEEIPTAAVT